MHEDQTISTEIADLAAMMRQKLRLGGATFGATLSRARRRMPRHVYRAAQSLAAAEPLADNPRLRLTLDHAALIQARRQVETFLAGIDPADDRIGWLLGVLASLVVNLLALFALLIAVMMWRGYL